MKSMTGYGRGEGDNGQIHIVAEVKAVNSRYCEIIIKQPRQYLALEEKIKKEITAQIERGRVEVFINAKDSEDAVKPVRFSQQQAIVYHQSLQSLAEALQVEYTPDIYRLATMPEVIVHEDREAELDEIWDVLQQALQGAIAQHMQMRMTEGAHIQADMQKKLADIEQLAQQVEQRSPLVVEAYRARLQEKIADLLGNVAVDEERLAQEVAYFAEKSCIDEELVRLKSHFVKFKEILAENGNVGRKLDFLIQELNRETNTIGSKANDLEISQLVVEMKGELEKLREQVQNIE